MSIKNTQELADERESINIADRLNAKITSTGNPTVVGLDPVLSAVPDIYKKPYYALADSFEAVARTYADFNRDIIDAVCSIVPAVKLQIAFYEKYGVQGLIAFKQTIDYARSKGLFVFEDGKRNDIGNTADAYAQGHLGKVELLNGEKCPSLDLDWLTVSPFLGKDSLIPFVDTCIANNKGIFILVKTSNPSSSDIQNQVTENGNTIYAELAKFVNDQAQRFVGKSGYSSIGAVVGATFPYEAEELRKIMPNSIFLVPGYGAQGGNAQSVVPCFNNDALGAIVNNSRGIMTAWQNRFSAQQCTSENFKNSVEEATLTMRDEIIAALKQHDKMFRLQKL
jgi:orotidine-5'-phosphate decarboxylase